MVTLSRIVFLFPFTPHKMPTVEELEHTISHHTLMYFLKRVHPRNLERARRVTETLKRRRRQMTVQTLLAESSRRRRDRKAYAPSQFRSEMIASSDESDSVCRSCKARHCPLVAKSKKNNLISCEACDNWLHCACPGIKSKRAVPGSFFCSPCSNSPYVIML